jgi:RimJ/RimL family protein N-acetyltransferase
MILDKPIITDRILMRTLDPGCLGSYWRWLNDPSINRYLEIRYAMQTEEGVKRYVEERNANNVDLLLGMYLRDGERHFGNIKITLSLVNNRGDVGIVLGESDLWGHGLAAEAIEALVSYAFKSLKLRKVCASAYSSNKASISTFLKAGFSIEGALKEHLRDGDDWVDQVYMAIFPEEQSDSSI